MWVSQTALDAAVAASVARAFAGRAPDRAEVDRYVAGLRLDDLALATACAAGVEAAWEHFMATHRPALLRAADAMDPTGGAREVAESLFADLYGLDAPGGRRQSLFRYFHGRSSLGTWLRAVLSQRVVDRVRARRRLEPLPDDPSALPSPGDAVPDPDRSRFQSAMQASCAAAIAALPPRDRLRLSLYYAQDMTLAAIGRVLKEHEATVSRHLSRTRVAIRAAVDARLRAEHGMDDQTIAECFRAAIDDAGTLNLAELTRDATAAGRPQPPRKKLDLDRSKR